MGDGNAISADSNKKRRLLGRSSEDRDISDDHMDVGERIASSCVSEAQKLNFYAPDKNDISVEYYLRMYVKMVNNRYVEWKRDGRHGDNRDGISTFKDSLPAHAVPFMAFLTRELMKSATLSVLPHFVLQFDIVQKICPELISPMMHAVISLRGFDLQHPDIELEFEALTLHQKMILTASALYAEFQDQRYESRVGILKNSKEADRYEKCKVDINRQ